MNGKSKLYKTLIAVIMAFIMFMPQCCITNVFADEAKIEESSRKEIVLFKGEAHASGSWDPWESLIDIKSFNVSDFNKPFMLEVEYEGANAPYIIFQSWAEGGNSWGQVQASFTSNGVAYYAYDACKEGYGPDFSELNNINVRPGGSDITITSVKLVPQDAKGVSVKYEGKAGKLVDSINAGWNLGNTLDTHGAWIKEQTDGAPERYETGWGNPVTTKEMIKKVKAAGFNAIRLPVTWYQHIDDENGYKVDKAWMDRVQEVVDYVMDEGLVCILNVHHDTGTEGWLRASEKSVNDNEVKFKTLWTQIADRFKDYDDNLVFEGFNEILDENNNWQYPGKEATSAVNKLNQMFVDTVRTTGGNNGERCLVVNTYAANIDGTVLDEFVLPTDTVENSLIVQIHSYIPYAYANTISKDTKQAAWKENGGKAVVDGMMLNLYHHFTSKNIPVIMGETAVANKDNLADRADYASYVVKNCKKYGVKCFWWDNGGLFQVDPEYGFETGCALLNRHTLEWVYPEIVEGFTGKKLNNAGNTDKPSRKEVVLYKGEAHASGSWDPWESLIDIKSFNVNDFNKPFTLEIEYEGAAGPYVIFQSWAKGGNSWGQVQPSFTSKGVAYYSYDACKEGYGPDFSELNNINIRPGGADVTITSVKLVPQENSEISVKYEGKAGEIVDNIGAGWNLGNTFDSHGDWIKEMTDGTPEKFESAWGNPVTTKEMIHKVKEAGFNSVRLPVTWFQHMNDENGYKVDKAWMDRVQEVVDYIIEEDMYCIINVHHDTGEAGWLMASEESVNNNEAKFKALWKQIADRFKDYDDKLLFEGFNEILNESHNWQYPGQEATTAVNKLNQMFVDTVRTTGGNNGERCLVVNTYAANTDGTVLDEFVLPKDTAKNSLIVQIHAYTPWSYANVISKYNTQTAWKENGGKAMIDGMLLNLYHHFTSNNIPVIMGEIAAANKENTKDRAEYAAYIVNNCKKYGVKCFWWDNGGNYEKDKEYGYYTGMGLLNRHTLKWVYPEIVEAFTGVNPYANRLLGDVNGDGKVNQRDYLLLRKYLRDNTTPINMDNADLNEDGVINSKDLTEIKKII